MRLSATKNLTSAEAVLLTTHRSSDGKNHADVVTNTADINGGKGPGVTTINDAGATVDKTYTAFIAPAAGQILALYAQLGTPCGGAETVDVDVQIAGMTALTAEAALVAGSGTNAVAGTVDGTANTFAAGEAITVVIVQTTGGADTAADLIVTVAWRLT
jgi:hypothetical protein